MKAQTELRDWVRNSGLKLGWVASKIPVSQSALSRWLNGKGKPSQVYRHRLADITEIEMLREEANWA